MLSISYGRNATWRRNTDAPDAIVTNRWVCPGARSLGNYWREDQLFFTPASDALGDCPADNQSAAAARAQGGGDCVVEREAVASGGRYPCHGSALRGRSAALARDQRRGRDVLSNRQRPALSPCDLAHQPAASRHRDSA